MKMLKIWNVKLAKLKKTGFDASYVQIFNLMKIRGYYLESNYVLRQKIKVTIIFPVFKNQDHFTQE